MPAALNKPKRNAVTTKGRKQRAPDPLVVRVIGWIAWIAFLAIWAIIIVGLVVEWLGGYSLTERHVLGGSVLMFLGLCLGGWVIWVVLQSFIVDGEWHLGATRAIRSRTYVVFGLLVLAGAGMLVFAAWGLSLTGVPVPGIEIAGAIAFVAFIAFALLALFAAAIAGAVLMGGWRSAWVGVALVAGLVGGSSGGVLDIPWLLWTGIGLMALAGLGYFITGTRGGFVPPSVLSAYSGWGVFVVGAGLIVLALINGSSTMVLYGAMTMAASLGIWLGHRGARLRASPSAVDVAPASAKPAGGRHTD
ncbi:hypothetical protein HII28_08480 [Planctomonas sp. JC2975]|uniref:hypothetical protein n=1 Tax=Planctomonas sp. JC2975 TaxID=2729626 RepID=UPI001472C853|nr:hypothetical protein [Planctomonas sp. JC2975]NNC11914.1 hypothetical protein [Planctomonas sp. JC2975]